MVYNPKLGAMSSPFGENPNEGSIIKEDPFELPPDEGIPSNVINGPQDIANMMDEAYGGLTDGHNKAQTKLSEEFGKKSKKKEVVEVKPAVKIKEETKKVTSDYDFNIDTKNEVLKNLISSGMKIKNVFDDVIIAEVNGEEVYISQK